MTKKAKLLERVRNSPKDAKFSEVQKLLKDAGFKERQPKGGKKTEVRSQKSAVYAKLRRAKEVGGQI